uniref:Uncharacterized protein n=1 Tax=Caenorhabditis tropicalis TaxID=1561998 RepID=A0A1I7TMB6_9PELO
MILLGKRLFFLEAFRFKYASFRPEKESSVRVKRAKPLEEEGLIPLAEGAEKKNPDPVGMVKERSKKSHKMRRSKKIKGYIVKQDRSVRRLENGKRYKSKTSLRCNRSVIEKSSKKSKKSKKSSRSSKKSKRSKEESRKSEQSKSSKKEKKSESGKKLKKKISSVRDENDIKRKQPNEEMEQKVEEEEEIKPKKFQKLRRPWKKLFKLKRKISRNDVVVEERNGTWA